MENIRVNILGIPVDSFTMRETLNIVNENIRNRKPTHHVVVNAAKLVNAQKDQQLLDSIVHCDIINPDGQSVVWASRLLNRSLPERVAGIDLMVNLVDMAAQNGYRIFLLGAADDVLAKLVKKYKEEYGESLIAGYRNGYFRPEEEEAVAREIAASNADLLFVAITSPKKEIFLNRYKDLIKVPFVMGVGGSFDVLAGKTKRAPLWMQKSGMEWFYRVIQEPGRLWKRYLFTNSRFIYLVLKEKLSH